MQQLFKNGQLRWEQMKKTELSEKTLFYILLVAFVLLLVPMLVISFYAAPFADDFNSARPSHAAWVATHSIWAALVGAWQQVKTSYVSWQGTFCAEFLFALQPGIWDERLYFLTTFMMLGSLITGMVLFCHTLLRRILNMSKYQTGIIALVILIACTQLLPSPIQGFFWYNGSVYYTFFFGVSLILYALVFHYVFLLADDTPPTRRVWYLIGMTLLSVMIGGSNYVTALATAMFYSLVVCGILWMKKRQRLDILIPIVIFAAAFLISALAPGNAIRQAAVRHVPAIFSDMLASFRDTAGFIREWSSLPLLALLTLLIPVLYPTASRLDFSFRCPALVVIFSYCLLSAMFFPPHFAMGDSGDVRLFDINYYAFVMFSIVDLFYVLGWFDRVWKRRFDGTDITEKAVRIIPSQFHLSLLVLVAIVVLIGGLFTIDAPPTSLRASQELISGEAAAYRDEHRQRLEILLDESKPGAVFYPYEHKPSTIFLDDISWDTTHWLNVGIQKYYGKEFVALRQR